MKAISLLSVGMNAEARAVAAEAVQLAFPGSSLSDAATIGEALKKEPPVAGPELLLLGDPDQASLAQATATTDETGLPRWTIIVFGAGPPGAAGIAATLAPEDWQARLVAEVFDAAVRLHALEQENARLKGDLSTIGRRISHDLRTPLAAICSAREALDETNPEQVADLTVFTRVIATSTNELMHLIGRLSFILKASAEASPTEPVVMDEIVFATLQRLEARILRKGAAVTRPATWPPVQGVPSWLEVIWLNLVDNALQHGGAVPQIELGWCEEPGQFRFWVNDRGPGVTPGKVGKLFQPFHLLHRLNAPRGLGLSLVQRLVELQGGHCGYEPRAEGGAHFFFTLRAAAAR